MWPHDGPCQSSRGQLTVEKTIWNSKSKTLIPLIHYSQNSPLNRKKITVPPLYMLHALIDFLASNYSFSLYRTSVIADTFLYVRTSVERTSYKHIPAQAHTSHRQTPLKTWCTGWSKTCAPHREKVRDDLELIWPEWVELHYIQILSAKFGDL